MNRVRAKEWLTKAWHHLSSGKILYDANHYTDTIAVDLHYAVEIMLKSFLAYENRKIKKTHSLVDIYKLIMEHIEFSEKELDLLDLITTYHIKEAYPPIYRELPTREEIKEVLDFSSSLFIEVCKKLDIDKDELKQ